VIFASLIDTESGVSDTERTKEGFEAFSYLEVVFAWLILKNLLCCSSKLF